MYGLRFMEKVNRGDPRRVYSLRQMAVCTTEELDNNLFTWTFVTPPSSAMHCFSKRLARQRSASTSAIFALHLIFFDYAVSSWRPYLAHLVEEVFQHVSRAPLKEIILSNSMEANTVLVAAPTGIGPVSYSACGDIQRLKQLGDQIIDTTVALTSTKSAVGHLIDDYTLHVVKTEKVQDSAYIDICEDDIIYQLTEYLRELEWLLQQTQGLNQKLNETRQLVQIPALYLLVVELTRWQQVSSLIAQGSASSLEHLGIEARKENSQMHELSKKTTQDAAAVKILSIMAMVYLPSTFVSVRARRLRSVFCG
jgi:hypothetical protein